MKNAKCNRSRGSIAALAFVAMLPLIAAIGGFAVDCLHFSDERAALQRATDAAALAGAYDLTSYTGKLNTSSSSLDKSTNELSVNDALQVATLNWVDGNSVTNNGKSITITATLGTIPASSTVFTALQKGSATTPNACQVVASMQIRSLFAQLFGSWSQTVSTQSIAGSQSNGATVDSFSYGVGYPLVLGLNDPEPPPGNGTQALYGLTVGSTFYFSMNNGPTSWGTPAFKPNAAWSDLNSTSAKANTAQGQYGTPGQPGGSFNPNGGTYLSSGTSNSVSLGQSVDVYGGSDTTISELACDNTLATTQAGTIIICPVVSSVNSGVSSSTPDATVIGFVELQLLNPPLLSGAIVTSYTSNIFQATVVQTPAPGLNLTNQKNAPGITAQPLLPHLIQ